MKVIISNDMEWQLAYADFDVEEVRTCLPTLFTNAKSIEVKDCEDDWLEVLVDKKYYAVHVTGDVKEGKLCEGRM